jgi:hypothetical protein
MTPAQPDPLAHPGRFADLYTFQWSELHFRTSMIAVIAVATALVGGVLAGHPSAGLIVGGGAMTVGFGLNQRISDSRLWPMIWATLSMSASTFVGMFAGHHGFGVVLAGAVWAFAFGVLTARAAGVAWVGQQAAVFLLVSSAFPADAYHAFLRALLTLLGGTLQIALTSLFLHLLPELRDDLVALPKYGLTGARHLRHTFGWRRMLRRLRGLPRALPRLKASSSVTYALRLAITVGLSCEVYRRLGVQSGYWIPMTALLVQKPAFTETLNRALMRIGGTLAGAVLSTYLLLHVHPDPIVLAWLASFFCFWAYMTNSVNYGLFAVFLTSYIVFLLSLNALPGREIAYRRAYATVIGGVIALVIHLDALRRRRKMMGALVPERT